MKIVIFVRHGQSEKNLMGILTSAGDHPLTKAGAEQAAITGTELEKIKGITAIYASPLPRAVQTAEIISRHIKLKPKLDDRLLERNVGILEGKPDPYDDDGIWKLDPGFKSESFESVKKRVKSFVDDLPKNSITLAVTHKDINCAAIALALGFEEGSIFEAGGRYCHMTIVDFDKKRILAWNAPVVTDALVARINAAKK